MLFIEPDPHTRVGFFMSDQAGRCPGSAVPDPGSAVVSMSHCHPVTVTMSAGPAAGSRPARERTCVRPFS